MFRSKTYFTLLGIAVSTLLAAPAARADLFDVTNIGGSNNQTLQLNSATGALSSYTTSTPSPQGIAINVGNTLGYVTNNVGNGVTTLTITNNAVTGTTTSGFAGLAQPVGISTDTAGNVYVVNNSASTSAGSIIRFNSTGTGATTLVSGLNTPQYVAVDSAGNIWVTELTNSGSGRIDKYSSTGTLLGQTTGNGALTPEGIKIGSNGNAFFVDNTNTITGQNTIWTWNGTNVGTVSQVATLTVSGSRFNGLAFDSAGNIFLTNAGSSGSAIYRESGGTIAAFSTSGAPSGFTPFDITPAPEPSSLVLSGVGVGLLGVYRRYRRRKATVVTVA